MNKKLVKTILSATGAIGGAVITEMLHQNEMKQMINEVGQQVGGSIFSELDRRERSRAEKERRNEEES